MVIRGVGGGKKSSSSTTGNTLETSGRNDPKKAGDSRVKAWNLKPEKRQRRQGRLRETSGVNCNYLGGKEQTG